MTVHPNLGEYHGHRRTDSTASSGSVATPDSGTCTIPWASCAHPFASHPVSSQFSSHRTIPTSIRAGEIIGYRAWVLGHELLRSVHADYTWTPGVQVAHERPRAHGTGFHAFKTLRQAVEIYSCYATGAEVVFGSIAMWGDVIEHQNGYRAEFAAIRSLDYSRQLNVHDGLPVLSRR